MSNRHQELTSPGQTATGKDFSNPLIVDSLLKTIWLSMHHVFTMKHWLVQSKRLLFWRSAEDTNDETGEVKITATIDGHSITITKASLKRHLKLDDHDGITSLPNSEIFEQLALMGYHTDSDKLTFQKGAFSPQWRFIQIYLDMHRNQLQQHTRTYHVPSLSIKVCNNIKRTTKGYLDQEVALFPTMLNASEPSTSPSRITSSPSPSPEPSHLPEPSFDHSPDHTTAAVSQPSPTQPSPTQPTPTQPSPRVDQHFPTPNESPLHAVIHMEVMRLILRVKKLESQIKTGKARRKTKVFLFEDDEDVEDDSSKQGRKLSDVEDQGKASTETEPIIQEVTPTKIIQDQGSSEKGNFEVSTTRAKKGTASEVPVISTAEVNISTAEVNISTVGRTVTYRRRSKEKRTRKDKGKAIMTEPEPKKKSKEELEQERLSLAEAIRLQEQMDEAQRAQ
ncbi:hypothetical protein Tco_0836871, partial [Tanacetum coccineum]